MAANRLVQARRSLPWMDPIEACRRIRAAGEQPTLLLSAGVHPSAKRSYLAWSPVRELVVRGNHMQERDATGHRGHVGNVAATLKQAVELFHYALEEPEGFTGGWVGYFGYEASPIWDATLPRLDSGTALPDAHLRFCLDVAVFDHTAQTLTLIVSSFVHGGPWLTKRLDDWQAMLATPTRPDLLTPELPSEVQWSTSLGESGFMAKVEDLKTKIHDGDLYQANLATRFTAPLRTDPLLLLERLREANPSPFMGFFEGSEGSIVSASPELLFCVKGGRIEARPIAGTRKRGAESSADDALAADLVSDPKERAEHTMLVDLVRNDLARVAKAGTVSVPEAYSVERYRHVMHLVSRVEAELEPATTFMDWMGALFPGGTVTGAPKHRACVRIAEAEPVGRGPYTGSMGYLSLGHNACWNILIRTLVLETKSHGPAVASIHAGSGIVADSDAGREWKEANRKARALLAVATGGDQGPDPGRLGDVEPTSTWSPPAPPRRVKARLLLIDNIDSFVHNLADYARSLGAVTKVIRNDANWRAAVAMFNPTHILLSPGPGWPQDSKATLEVLQEMPGKVPILGVCLGHQAMAQVFGGEVARHPVGPVHGRADLVRHDGTGLFEGLPTPLSAARYHSLVATQTGPELRANAWLEDGTVMAMQHRKLAVFGLQVHPESLCTPQGLELLARFLETTP